MSGIHDFSATTLDGREQSLADYKGKVVPHRQHRQ